MNKILLALTILSAGAGGFLTARHSTTQLARETTANREAWLVQTQLFAAVQDERADLAGRIRGLKTSLAQPPPVAENALWSMLQTNRADDLPAELRERLLEELGFNWQTSPDFIVVTKRTLFDTGDWMLGHGKLSEVAAAIFAMTPEERRQVEVTVQRAHAEYNDWALAHVERREPGEGELAQYYLPGDPAMQESIRTNFAAGIVAALGKDRANFMDRSVWSWMGDNVDLGTKGATLFIRRELVGNEQRLKAERFNFDKRESGVPTSSGYFPEFDLPTPFRPIFPNGWADVAKREGFELPKESSEK